MHKENYLYLYRSIINRDCYGIGLESHHDFSWYERVSPLKFITVRRNTPTKNIYVFLKYFVWSI